MIPPASAAPTPTLYFWRIGNLVLHHGQVLGVCGDIPNSRLVLFGQNGMNLQVPVDAEYMHDILNYCLAHLRDHYCRDTWDEDWDGVVDTE